MLHIYINLFHSFFLFFSFFNAPPLFSPHMFFFSYGISSFFSPSWFSFHFIRCHYYYDYDDYFICIIYVYDYDLAIAILCYCIHTTNIHFLFISHVKCQQKWHIWTDANKANRRSKSMKAKQSQAKQNIHSNSLWQNDVKAKISRMNKKQRKQKLRK